MKCQFCGSLLRYEFAPCERCGRRKRSQEDAQWLNQTLGGRFHLTRFLGEGLIGAVYEGEDQQQNNRKVAVKIVHDSGADVLERLEKAVSEMRKLSHEAVVKVIEIGKTNLGHPWLAMQFVDGITLKDYLREREPLSLEATVNLLEPLAEVLVEAHAKGVLHRTLSAQNLMLLETGLGEFSLRVLETALVTVLEGSSQEKKRLRGAPAYMPPEQWEGEASEASDLYSFAILVQECLSGKQPWSAEDVYSWRYQHMEVEPKLLSPLQEGDIATHRVQQLLNVALRKDPKQRTTSLEQFWQDFCRIEGGKAANAKKQKKQKTGGGRVFSWKKLSFALVTLGLLSALGYAIWKRRQEPEKPTEPKLLAAVSTVRALSTRAVSEGELVAAKYWCDRGEQIACNDWGVILADGLVGERDEAKAVSLFSRACDDREVHACANLGFMVRDARGTSQDLVRAVGLFDDVCEQGLVDICKTMCIKMRRSADRLEEFSVLAPMCLRACEAGDASGCVTAGSLFEAGKGVVQEFPKALSLYQKACDGDRAEGCEYAAELLFMPGTEVTNFAKAVEMFEKSCGKKDKSACLMLAIAKEEGRGTKADAAAARAIFETACEEDDNKEACFRLGRLMAEGRGGPKDTKQAKTLLEVGCKSGEVQACGTLGDIYANERGKDKQEGLALYFWKHSCEKGDKKRCAQRDALAENLRRERELEDCLAGIRSACEAMR